MNQSNTTPRIAVIGGGHLGRIHAKLLATNPHCLLECVVDSSPISREIVQNSLGLRAVDDYRSLSGKVDGVVIAAPTFLHHEIGSWCLQRGIHVFMEKPIAASPDQAHELVALAHENQAVLQVGHVERFNPAWATIRNTTDRDSIRYIEAAREGTYTGRSTDIGIVMDLMIHDIDLILSLVQSPVAQVEAHGWSVLGSHEDFAVAHLKFKNGTFVQLKASRISESPKRAMTIHCDDGIKHVDFSTSCVTTIEPVADVANGARQADALNAEERAKVKDKLFIDWLRKQEIKPESVNAIGLEHSEFVEAILGNKSVTVSGHAGTAALSVADEIVRCIHQTSAQQAIIPAAGRFAA